MSNDKIKSIGQQMTAAREARGWTLEEAAKRTKLRKDTLALMEADQFERLPSMAYARGFIRLYARELNLDGWTLLKNFGGVVDESIEMLELHPDDLESIPKRSTQPVATPQGVGLFVVIAILLLALGIGAYQVYRVWPGHPHKNEAPTAEVTQTEPAKKPDPSLETPHALPVSPAPPNQAAAGPDASIPKAQPVNGTPVAPVVAESPAPKAQPVNDTPAPTDGSVPKAVPVQAQPEKPAEVKYPNRLELQADATAGEELRWVRVVAVRGNKEEALFADTLPAGDTVPKTDQPAWTGDSFIINMREAGAINIIYNGKNFGKYEATGPQRIRIPNP